ncbi:hypothetical protein M378DRAFT_157437 [Amanita muscaria Koide BX008]|uniref:Uncharacterized protein n=1 Tax=Amanita muscaria (strain Koide BX008) TaxID=946122 RepID=A0A0C2T072_AMAMK|nr:hypothetical protein M378DRAFT_157437 [Amanita muscaria Koide BX008]
MDIMLWPGRTRTCGLTTPSPRCYTNRTTTPTGQTLVAKTINIVHLYMYQSSSLRIKIIATKYFGSVKTRKIEWNLSLDGFRDSDRAMIDNTFDTASSTISPIRLQHFIMFAA